MASEAKLDQIVKGAPPPHVSPTQIAESAKAQQAHQPQPQQRPPTPTSTAPPTISTTSTSASSTHRPTPHLPAPNPTTTTQPSDPRDTLPSSPPQIYLNLLILESSLRLQYLSLRARLRVNILLLLALLAWNATFTYLLFFRPREDGSGVGGSVYWVLETGEKLGWCSGIVTCALFWGTGMYERGVRWPRKFIGTTNRGLRGFNMKVVVVKGSLRSEVMGWAGLLSPTGWIRDTRVQFQVLPRDIEAVTSTASHGGEKESAWNSHALRHGLVEEDIAPSGDVLKLLLLPKPFSPDFREGWETYRMEFWERENLRRHELRRLYRLRVREVARREGGWLWWTGWRGWRNARVFRNAGKTRRQIDLEKVALRERASTEILRERKRNALLMQHARTESHSRSSSRSTTPTPEPERLARVAGATGTGAEDAKARRRGSSAASQRRRMKALAAGNPGSRLSIGESFEIPMALSKRTSTLSVSSRDSDEVSVKREDESAEVKSEGGES